MPRKALIFFVCLAILLTALIVNISLGAVNIQSSDIWEVLLRNVLGKSAALQVPGYVEAIIWELRVPHALLIGFTGAALAGSGAVFQGLFRNPLADPYIIGVASGAGLGAIIAINNQVFGESFGIFLVPITAFIGAVVTIYLVYLLAKIDQLVPVTTLILAGVAVGAFVSSINSLIILRSDQYVVRSLAYLFGGSPVSGWKPVLAAAPIIFIGLLFMSLLGHQINILQFGDEQARQLGQSPEKIKRLIILIGSATTAAAVSFSGIIGFVGLVAPHIVRIVISSDYKKIIPYSIVIGAVGLLISDVVARIIVAPQSLPVGIITAFFGAPFFLWILKKAKEEVFW